MPSLAVRETAERTRHLVNNLNPYRLEGQKTPAFEIVGRARRRARPAVSAGGTAGTTASCADSASRDVATHEAAAPARRPGAGAAPMCTAYGRRAPRRSRRRSASAARCAFQEVKAAVTGRRGRAAVTDDVHPRGLHRLPESEGVSASRPRPHRCGARTRARAGRSRGRRARRLHPHRRRRRGYRDGGRG